MESSKFWKLRRRWLEIRQKFNLGTMDTLYQSYLTSIGENSLLDNTSPSAIANREGILISDNRQYQKWLIKNYPKPSKLQKIKAAIAQVTYQPLISIIVPVYNPSESFLRQAIESVLAQVYPNWELCLADDCSTEPYVKSVLEEYAQQDNRIKVTFRPQNGHICHTSNSALELATGEYIALLDHDDLLPPHALATVVELLNKHPEADFIYSDEDKVDEKNIHKDPFFKPDWCPDSFLSRMYTCHLGIYRRSLVTEIGNFRVGFEGSQDYDLVLRVTEKTNKIFHIPDVLYHWRIHQQSAAFNSNTKPYATNAAQKALTEALERRGELGLVTPAKFPGVYTVRYQIKEPKLVSIIIPTKDLADLLDVCLKSIFTKTTYPHYEVIVIDNGSTEAKTSKCFDYWQQQQGDRFQVYQYNIPFNYSQINNYGVEQAQGDYLLFLNNDTEVITPDWLEAMVEQAQRSSIGAVGSLLLYPDDTIQHAGVVLGIGGVAGHSHKHLPVKQPGYISQAVSINNYSALTAACLMCRRTVFEEVGGFEEQLAIAFNDVDFCLKIISRGYRNIYLPHVALYHYESKSRGYEDTPAKQTRFAGEINYMRQKWQELCDRDPCYNPNLTKNLEDYSLNI
ncbi:MAG: glycosyltransferase family 2 protein [Waterburya sp.]